MGWVGEGRATARHARAARARRAHPASTRPQIFLALQIGGRVHRRPVAVARTPGGGVARPPSHVPRPAGSRPRPRVAHARHWPGDGEREEREERGRRGGCAPLRADPSTLLQGDTRPCRPGAARAPARPPPAAAGLARAVVEATGTGAAAALGLDPASRARAWTTHSFRARAESVVTLELAGRETAGLVLRLCFADAASTPALVRLAHARSPARAFEVLGDVSLRPGGENGGRGGDGAAPSRSPPCHVLRLPSSVAVQRFLRLTFRGHLHPPGGGSHRATRMRVLALEGAAAAAPAKAPAKAASSLASAVRVVVDTRAAALEVATAATSTPEPTPALPAGVTSVVAAARALVDGPSPPAPVTVSLPGSPQRVRAPRSPPARGPRSPTRAGAALPSSPSPADFWTALPPSFITGSVWEAAPAPAADVAPMVAAFGRGAPTAARAPPAESSRLPPGLATRVWALLDRLRMQPHELAATVSALPGVAPGRSAPLADADLDDLAAALPPPGDSAALFELRRTLVGVADRPNVHHPADVALAALASERDAAAAVAAARGLRAFDDAAAAVEGSAADLEAACSAVRSCPALPRALGAALAAGNGLAAGATPPAGVPIVALPRLLAMRPGGRRREGVADWVAAAVVAADVRAPVALASLAPPCRAGAAVDAAALPHDAASLAAAVEGVLDVSEAAGGAAAAAVRAWAPAAAARAEAAAEAASAATDALAGLAAYLGTPPPPPPDAGALLGAVAEVCEAVAGAAARAARAVARPAPAAPADSSPLSFRVLGGGASAGSPIPLPCAAAVAAVAAATAAAATAPAPDAACDAAAAAGVAADPDFAPLRASWDAAAVAVAARPPRRARAAARASAPAPPAPSPPLIDLATVAKQRSFSPLKRRRAASDAGATLGPLAVGASLSGSFSAALAADALATAAAIEGEAESCRVVEETEAEIEAAAPEPVAPAPASSRPPAPPRPPAFLLASVAATKARAAATKGGFGVAFGSPVSTPGLGAGVGRAPPSDDGTASRPVRPPPLIPAEEASPPRLRAGDAGHGRGVRASAPAAVGPAALVARQRAALTSFRNALHAHATTPPGRRVTVSGDGGGEGVRAVDAADAADAVATPRTPVDDDNDAGTPPPHFVATPAEDVPPAATPTAARDAAALTAAALALSPDRDDHDESPMSAAPPPPAARPASSSGARPPCAWPRTASPPPLHRAASPSAPRSRPKGRPGPGEEEASPASSVAPRARAPARSPPDVASPPRVPSAGFSTLGWTAEAAAADAEAAGAAAAAAAAAAERRAPMPQAPASVRAARWTPRRAVRKANAARAAAAPPPGPLEDSVRRSAQGLPLPTDGGFAAPAPPRPRGLRALFGRKARAG